MVMMTPDVNVPLTDKSGFFMSISSLSGGLAG
jgi:hypothetical protein